MHIVLTDAYIEVDDTDISEHCDTVTVHTEDDVVEATGFGSRYKTKLKGIGDATITVETFNDFEDTNLGDAAGSLDAFLWALKQRTTPFAVKVRPTSDAVSTENPQYVMEESLLFTHDPVTGSVSEAAKTTLTFENAGQNGIIREDGAS